MINHDNCDHARTSAARAKCRRAIRNGAEAPKATGRTIDFKGSGGTKSRTPRDKDKACDVCGVERITAKGTELLSGTLLYTGDKCRYMIQNDPNLVELD